MDFDFSDEQYAFRDSLRAFLAGEFAGPKPQASRPTLETSERVWSGLAELGLFSVLVPEEHGGLGLGLVDLALGVEEFGRSLMLPAVLDTLVATDIIARFGSDEQKRNLLPAIAAGRYRVALAAMESQAGYDPADIATRAVGEEPRARLKGRKILVANASAADALLVSYRSGEDSRLALALIETERAGLEWREHETIDPSCAYHEVSFDLVSVAPSDRLGVSRIATSSDSAASRLLDLGAVLAATSMTGIAGRVLDLTVDYVKQRVQFGKTIGSFQSIKHRCADMLVTVDAARSAAYYAAWALANDARDRVKAVSIAKSLCGDGARFVCNEGIQLHGGMGFTWELGLHFFLRRAKMLEYCHGDAIFHRRRLLNESLAELETHIAEARQSVTV